MRIGSTFVSGLALSILIPIRCFGTLAVVEVRPDRIIIAAESHEIVPGSFNGSDDLGCKIVPLGTRTFLFTAGFAIFHVGLDKHLLSTGDIAREVFNQQNPMADDYGLIRLVAQWGDRVRELLKMYPARDLPLRPALTEGVFGGTSGIALQAYHATLGLTRIPISGNAQISVNTVSLYDRSDPIEVVGAGYARPWVMEFLDNKSARAVAANRIFTSAFPNVKDGNYEPSRLASAIEAAITWAPPNSEIGGPVDVLVLDHVAGIRWVRRKPSCREK